MRRASPLAVIPAFLFATAHAAPPAPGGPASAASSICRPVFKTGDGDLEAGTAFVVRRSGSDAGKNVLVTAHHLFGPDGGLERQHAWNELPAFVRSVKCAPMKKGTPKIAGGRAFAVSGARVHSEKGPACDVAVFPLADSKAPALSLSSELPPVKSRVWLVAELANARPGAPLLHGATVVQADNEWISFVYDDPTIDIQATSGAPVVDESGRVVGINIGAMTQGKKRVGMAQSSPVLIGAIARGGAGTP
jgi:hypothetical protein